MCIVCTKRVVGTTFVRVMLCVFLSLSTFKHQRSSTPFCTAFARAFSLQKVASKKSTIIGPSGVNFYSVPLTNRPTDHKSSRPFSSSSSSMLLHMAEVYGDLDGTGTQETQSISEGSYRVVSYLRDTIDCLNHPTLGGEEFRLAVTEQHRKSMMRAVLGWSKQELETVKRDLILRLEWKRTRHFIEGNYQELQALATEIAEDARPTFEEALEIYTSYQDRPSKVFVHFARGRTYQGKFERLLQDVQPDWLEEFDSIFRWTKASSGKEEERELWEHLAVEQEEAGLLSAEYIQLLKVCIDRDFPSAIPQLPDGGKSKGVQTEMNLMSYLKDQVHLEYPSQFAEEKTSTDIGRVHLLGPVYLQNKRKGRNPNKKCPYVIEVPVEMDLFGRSTELDAIVVQVVAKDQVRILQVWEAKATINPVTIGDALNKKGRTMRSLVSDCLDATLSMGGMTFSILPSSTVDETTTDGPPLFGLFGKSLMPPSGASRRIQTVFGERLLEQDPKAVADALECGSIRIPKDPVQAELESLIQTAEELHPILVISSEL